MEWYYHFNKYEIYNIKTKRTVYKVANQEPKLAKNQIIKNVIKGGQVYVSFSGGKDSTVLLDLARRAFPDIEAVFVDTGLEYPEIRNFVKTFGNVTWLYPQKYDNKQRKWIRASFEEVIIKHGYPVVSKETSKKIRQIKNPNVGDKYRTAMLYGDERGTYTKIAEKWKFLLNAPFECSERCCDFMKKNPFYNYERNSKKLPISGQMACESRGREKKWLQRGCNAFKGRKISNPMSFWTEQDVLQYIKLTGIPIASIYGDIVSCDGDCEYDNTLYPLKLKTTGVHRTGCMFCMFGVHLEKEPNRFQRMKETHPKQYDYCISETYEYDSPIFDDGDASHIFDDDNGISHIVGYERKIRKGLGCGKVLDYIGVPY